MSVCSYANMHICVDVRKQLVGVDSLLPTYGFWGCDLMVKCNSKHTYPLSLVTDHVAECFLNKECTIATCMVHCNQNHRVPFSCCWARSSFHLHLQWSTCLCVFPLLFIFILIYYHWSNKWCFNVQVSLISSIVNQIIKTYILQAITSPSQILNFIIASHKKPHINK